MVVVTPVTDADSASAASMASRGPRMVDFVRLKLRLLRNGLRGQTRRVVALLVGVLIGVWLSGLAIAGFAASAYASRDIGFVSAAFAGAAVVLGWTLLPLLFFGVDETIDPARFGLLPIRPGMLARGMLAAALVGVPPAVTLLATGGLVLAAAIRFGAFPAAAAAAGVIAGLVLGVIASRAVISQFAAMLRSRRVRDLAIVMIAVLASSVAPLQLLITTSAADGDLDQAVDLAEILGWTPLAAPYVLSYDVADGHWAQASARLAITAATIVVLGWWWSRTIEGAMIGVSTAGHSKQSPGLSTKAVSALIPWFVRGRRPAAFSAIVARELRSWWRDPRRRASLVSTLMASAVVPIALKVTSSGAAGGPPVLSSGGLAFAVTMAGAMGGMLLANQFGYDASAYAAHLLAPVPGRVDVRARASALALVAVPVQLVVVGAVAVVDDFLTWLPAGVGILAAAFGATVTSATMLSVLVPYALPDSSNPFAIGSGSGSAKGLLALAAMLGTLVLCLPVVLAASALAGVAGGPWLVFALGAGYGGATGLLGTHLAGGLLDRRGPEILASVTPTR